MDPQNRGSTVDAAAGATGATAERTRESMKVGMIKGDKDIYDDIQLHG